MTVKELIKELEKYNPDAKVRISVNDVDGVTCTCKINSDCPAEDCGDVVFIQSE